MSNENSCSEVSDSTSSKFGTCIAIFSSRESVEALVQTILASMATSDDHSTLIDVLVNGNASLAESISRVASESDLLSEGGRLRVWFIPLGDKAHTWNTYVHQIAPSGSSYVFIDGYARVTERALVQLVNKLHSSAGALAVTGVPTCGRNAVRDAENMLAHGGIHGNLCAFKSETIEQFRRIGFRLPLGMYRIDSTFGAAINFGLDLYPRHWVPKERIVCEPNARWLIDPLSIWRFSDLKTHFKRVVRQAQGDLENAAVHNIFSTRREPFNSLPMTVSELILSWMQREPEQANKAIRWSVLRRNAVRKLRRPRDWSMMSLPARCLYASP